MTDRDFYSSLSDTEFKAVWQTLLALAPGLHPDEIGNYEGGWEDHPVISAIGQEALSRHESGELSDDEFYDAEAQRSGLPNREEYPSFSIDREFYKELSEEEFQAVWKTLLELPLELDPNNINLQNGWGENPITEAIGEEAKFRLKD